MIECCLSADPDSWKRMPMKCSITMVYCGKISGPFKENNNVIIFPFPFHIFMLLAKYLNLGNCIELYSIYQLKVDSTLNFEPLISFMLLLFT